MITEIIEPQSATYVLHLPQEYVNRRVEISISLAAPCRPREVPSYLQIRELPDDIDSLSVPIEELAAELTLASEKLLASDWLKPEEEEAWNYL